MIRIISILAIFYVLVDCTKLDVSNIGITQQSHQTNFAEAIPVDSALEGEEAQQLQLMDSNIADEEASNAAHVKEMFSKAFKTIRSERQQAQTNTEK